MSLGEKQGKYDGVEGNALVLNVVGCTPEPRLDTPGSPFPEVRELRIAAGVFALAIVRHTPACADQTAAIRKVREAVMTAAAAVTLGGQS